MPKTNDKAAEFSINSAAFDFCFLCSKKDRTPVSDKIKLFQRRNNCLLKQATEIQFVIALKVLEKFRPEEGTI